MQWVEIKVNFTFVRQVNLDVFDCIDARLFIL